MGMLQEVKEDVQKGRHKRFEEVYKKIVKMVNKSKKNKDYGSDCEAKDDQQPFVVNYMLLYEEVKVVEV